MVKNILRLIQNDFFRETHNIPRLLNAEESRVWVNLEINLSEVFEYNYSCSNALNSRLKVHIQIAHTHLRKQAHSARKGRKVTRSCMKSLKVDGMW